MRMRLPYENFALAQGYLKMSVGYVNFRNLSQSPPIHDPSHLPVYPCRVRPSMTPATSLFTPVEADLP